MIASIWLVAIPPWCLPVAFAPLFVLWQRASNLRSIAAYGLVTAVVTSAIAFFWVAEAVERTFGLPSLWSYACWIGFAVVANLHVPVIGVIWRFTADRLQLSATLRWTLLPLLWIAIASVWPKPLPFDYGYPWLWSELPVLQLADILGFSGLALATFALNVLVARAWLERRARLVSFGYVASAIGLLAGLCGAGALHVASQSAPDRSIRLRLVQPNAPAHSFDPHAAPGRETAQLLYSLVRQSLESTGEPQADVWIWPEGALPLWLGKPAHDRAIVALMHSLRTRGVPLVAGAGTGGEIGTFYNSVITLDAHGRRGAVYRKNLLFPFETWNGAGAGLRSEEALYRAGRGVAETPILDLSGVRFGPSLCFEGLFPSLFRTSSERGAQIFVNLASDRRFGSFAEPYEHLFMTLARAIEFRRPVVRVAATGISAVIGSDGTILARAPLGEAWTQTVEVPYREHPSPTFYQSHGSLLPWAWSLLAVAICLAGRRRQPSVDRRNLVRGIRGWLGSAARLRASRPLTTRPVAKKVGLVVWIAVGGAHLSGVWLEQPWLAALGRLSASSPFPLVFGQVEGHEYWAARTELRVTLSDGSDHTIELDPSLFARLPGSHRAHMLLALPYSFGPVIERDLWAPSLRHGLCHDGPVARAADLPLHVDRATLTVDPGGASEREAWSTTLRCPG